jgi:two-component system C4-dicarboxylate transport sensor histidine kinase DctB
VNKKQLLGIRGRLLLAFVVLSAFTLFASAVGWVSHSRIAQELDNVVKGSLSALQIMAKIKEHGVRITTIAPTLLRVADQHQQQRINHTLGENITAMMASLSDVAPLLDQPKEGFNLQAPLEQLREIIGSLNKNVTLNLDIQLKKQLLNRQLRWAGSVFLSDIDGVSELIQRKVYSRFDQDPPVLTSIIDSRLQAMYRLKADVNLLINLLDRAQYVPDLNSIIATNIYADEVVLRILSDLVVLEQLIPLQELRKTITHIIALGQAEQNIFEIRGGERAVAEKGEALLAQTYNELDNLNVLLDLLAKQAQKASESALENTQTTIDQGRLWMVSIVAGSLLFSILIVWLYVGRNMVARITNLDAAMRSIANGNLAQQVPVSGSDEIGAMGRSLEQFRDQLSSLQEEIVQSGRLAALGQLSAGIAHEINQPLSAIRHYARNGERLIKAQRVEEAEGNLHQISSLTMRAITIIKRLKSLAKDDQQNLISIELSNVVNSALEVLIGDKLLTEKELSINYHQDQYIVRVDPIQLEQVIINLLTNAMDSVVATTEKKIQIECKDSQDYVLIYVRDNGCGISSEIQEKIFDPFFTTKTRGQSLGLGLSISYNIIQNFAGKLSIERSDAFGTSFCIQLPKVFSKMK